MCPSCFEIEFPSFATHTEWTDFDVLLSLKLNSHKMKCVEEPVDPSTTLRVTKTGEYTYECLSCKQKWKLHDPDRDSRGSFIAL
jgi:hypothetical protein